MSSAGLQCSWNPVPEVDSLNGLTDDISLVCPDSSITITPNRLTKTIALRAVSVAPQNVVDSLNGLKTTLNLTSTDSSITITPDNVTKTINLVAVPPTPPTVVDSLNGVQTAVSLTSTDSSITITPDLVAKTINLVAVPPTPPTVVDSLNGVQTAVNLTSTDSSITITPDLVAKTINLSNPVFQGTYYKSVNQNLTSPTTDVTFDLTGSWNNTGGCITHVNGTKDFTVVRAGLYQLEFNYAVLVNGASGAGSSNKTCIIDINRVPSGEHAIILNSAQIGPENYGQCVSGTFYLRVGDIIDLRVGKTFTSGGPPQLIGLANTFDLNTFFSWRFIS